MTASIRGSQKTAKSCVKDAQEEEEVRIQIFDSNLKFVTLPDNYFRTCHLRGQECGRNVSASVQMGLQQVPVVC